MSLRVRRLVFPSLLLTLACGPLGSSAAQTPSGETTRHSPDKEPTDRPRPAIDDEKQITQLAESIARLRREGKFAEAIEAAGQIVTILERAVGPEHWRTADARRSVETFRAIAGLPEDGRRAMASVVSREEQASSLQRKNQLREAETIRRGLAEDLRRWLGEEHPDTVTNSARLAVILDLQGRSAEARPLMQKALDIGCKVLGEGHPETARSYNGVAVNLARQGRYAEARPPMQRALEIRRKALGEGHPETAQSYSNLALLLSEEGRYAEAEPLLQRALHATRKALGETHPETITCLNSLATNLDEQGRHAEAEPLLRRALEARRAALGEDHLDTAESYNDLAVSLARQGRYADAEPLYRKALDAYRKVLGEGHPATARSYCNLGGTLTVLGRYPEADPLLRRALDIRRNSLGEDHPDTAKSYMSLASNLARQGRYAEAEPMLRKALDIERKALGDRHPDTAKSYQHLGINLEALGRYAEAEPMLRKALEILREALREGHPALAGAYESLGLCLLNRGRYAEAEPMLRKALELERTATGEGLPHAAEKEHHLALLMDRLGRYTEAEPLLRRVLRIRRVTLGEDHPDTAETYAELARSLRGQGRYADARPSLQRALDIRRKTLGEAHRLTGSSYTDLACNLHDQGWYAESEPLFRRALDTYRKALGDAHPDTGARYIDLAASLNVQGRYADAEPLYRKALAIRRNSLGEGHPDTAESYGGLGVCLLDQGRFAEAEPMLRRALEARRAALGEGHPKTADSYTNLGAGLTYQGRYAEAEPLFRKALEARRGSLGEDHPDMADGSKNLALCLDARGRLDEAMAFYEAAAAGFERSRWALAITGIERAQARTSSPLTALAVALARQGRPREAWRRWEADLARGLLDDQTARTLRPLTAAERQRETEFLVRLHSLDERIGLLVDRPRPTQDDDRRLEGFRRERDTLHGEYVEFERALEEEHGEFAGRPAGLERVQAALPRDTALLGWVGPIIAEAPDPQHWACLLRHEGDPIWVKVPAMGEGQSRLKGEDRRVGELRAALESRDPGWQEVAEVVAARMLGPLRDHLQGVRRLVVLPSTALAEVPVEVLLAAWPEAPKDLVVSYAPSGTMFERLTRPGSGAAAPPRLLAVGDPAYPAEEPATPPPPPASGVAVRSVEPHGNADLAGVRPGDVLLTYDGRNLNARADLVPRPADGPDKRVQATLWRDGEVRAVELAAGALGIQLEEARTAAEAVLARQSADALLKPLIRGHARQRLSGTRGEVEAIVGLFPGERATVLLGEAASAAALEVMARSGSLKGYRYLHFAAHGETNPAVALSSALILAPDLARPADPTRSGTDGRVTAQQIAYTWELDADLVVLSACESGLGRYAHGEGYLGFAQALFLKGARSLVVSQWKVNDRSTALLMARFYQNLLGRRAGLRQPLAKAEALGEAKRWLSGLTAEEAGAASSTPDRGVIRPLATSGQSGPDEGLPARPGAAGRRPYAHPYYWAAFVLVGDPGPLGAQAAGPDPGRRGARDRPGEGPGR
jgi:tetratricopeptide (TPR) repeat protein